MKYELVMFELYMNKSTSVASEVRPRPAQGASWTTSSSFIEFWDPQDIDFGSLEVPQHRFWKPQCTNFVIFPIIPNVA